VGPTRTPWPAARVLAQGTDLSFYSQDHFDAVAFELNNLPRQTLDRLKPCERLDQLLSDANDALTG
jgi:IS30 family transposase